MPADSHFIHRHNHRLDVQKAEAEAEAEEETEEEEVVVEMEEAGYLLQQDQACSHHTDEPRTLNF
jgi:hypothetical protein